MSIDACEDPHPERAADGCRAWPPRRLPQQLQGWQGDECRGARRVLRRPQCRPPARDALANRSQSVRSEVAEKSNDFGWGSCENETEQQPPDARPFQVQTPSGDFFE